MDYSGSAFQMRALETVQGLTEKVDDRTNTRRVSHTFFGRPNTGVRTESQGVVGNQSCKVCSKPHGVWSEVHHRLLHRAETKLKLQGTETKGSGVLVSEHQQVKGQGNKRQLQQEENMSQLCRNDNKTTISSTEGSLKRKRNRKILH